MELGALIRRLESTNQALTIPRGFHYPHSSRGDYQDLGFEPKENTLVSDMLRDARGALGKEFTGYKGGEFEMNEFSRVLLANYGHSCLEGGVDEGGAEELGARLLEYMLAEGFLAKEEPR